MAIRYTVPPLEFDKDFSKWDDDKFFDMQAQADFLTSLVGDVEEPLVIGFNAEWGTGKTVFLRRWKHLNDKAQTGIKVVYFDAFENDCLDDPFTALTAEILKELGENAELKQKAIEVIKSAIKVGASGMGLGYIAEAINEIDDIFKDHKSRKAEIEAFKKKLGAIAEKEGRLVIIVDELDRCRPDFALAALEQIKHLFDVDNVHFILGYKEDSLMNIIKTRYGADIDAKKYLDKFITVHMKHELKIKSIDGSDSLYNYFWEKYNKMKLHTIFDTLDIHILKYSRAIFKDRNIANNNPPLRDVNQLLTKLALTPLPNFAVFSDSLQNMYSKSFVIFLIFIRSLNFELYEKLKRVENYENDRAKAKTMCNEVLTLLGLLGENANKTIKAIIIYHLDCVRHSQEISNEPETSGKVIDKNLRDMFAAIERVQIPSVDKN